MEKISQQTFGWMVTGIAVALPLIGMVTAGARGEPSPNLAADFIFVGAVAAVSILMFTVAVPRIEKASVGLVLSIVAVVTAPIFFWTMIPIIFGGAGAYIGLTVKGGVGRAAMILGLAGAAFSVMALIVTS